MAEIDRGRWVNGLAEWTEGDSAYADYNPSIKTSHIAAATVGPDLWAMVKQLIPAPGD